MGRRAKSKSAGKRMAKMVSSDTARLINELAELIRVEQNRESRVSDNDVIRIAVMESIKVRQ